MLSLEHEASTVSAEAGVGPTLRWLQDLLPTSTPLDRNESQA
jgi:hypothetical protein